MRLSSHVSSFSSNFADDRHLHVRLHVCAGPWCVHKALPLPAHTACPSPAPLAPTGNFLQLQEVRLFGDDGAQLRIASVSNPLGESPDNQAPGDAIDNDLGYLFRADCSPVCCTYASAPCTAQNSRDFDCDCGDVCHCSRGSKWLDLNMGRAHYNSTLLLTLAAPAQLDRLSYELITADDSMQRDPTSWTFYGQYDGAWVPLKTEEVVPPMTRYTSYGITPLVPSPPVLPGAFIHALPPRPAFVHAPRPSPPPSPSPPPPSPQTPRPHPPPQLSDVLETGASMTDSQQQGPHEMPVLLIYVLAGCGGTLLFLMGGCGVALLYWCLRHRQVLAAALTHSAPHRTRPHRLPFRPHPNLSCLALQVRSLFQPYVEPASAEFSNSPHMQLQSVPPYHPRHCGREEAADDCMSSEQWEEEGSLGLQPLPPLPSDPTHAITNQHWRSLASLPNELPHEWHDELHDVDDKVAEQCKVPSGTANAVPVRIREVGYELEYLPKIPERGTH